MSTIFLSKSAQSSGGVTTLTLTAWADAATPMIAIAASRPAHLPGRKQEWALVI
jgi:hypothetical protein